MTEEFRVALFNHPLDVDWPTEGDEWFKHLGDALQEAGAVSGWGAGWRAGLESKHAGGQAYFELAPAEGSALSSRLWLAPDGDAMWTLIVGGDIDNIEKETSAWRAAVSLATERVGGSHVDFEWKALLGPAIRSPAYTIPVPDTEVSCGALRLIPAESSVWEYRSRNLVHKEVYEAWPIEVRGHARGFELMVALQQARGDLNQLCALLSVAIGAQWVTKFGPGSADQELTLPAPYDEAAGEPVMVMFAGERRTQRLPSWFSDAWERVGSSPILRSALVSHYEGLRRAGCQPTGPKGIGPSAAGLRHERPSDLSQLTRRHDWRDTE